MANDNRRWLYDTLKMKGVDLGTYEQFDQAMRNDPKTQKWAFGVANQHGIQLGTYEQYSAGMELQPIRQTTPAESPESGARVAENPIQQQQQPDRITSAFAAMKDPYSAQYNYHQEVAEKERQLQKEKAAKIPMSPMDAARENEIRRLSPGYSGFAMGVDENGNMVPRGPQFNMPTIGVNPNQKRIDELKSQQPSYITREVKTPQDLLVNTAEAWTANTPEGRATKNALDAGTISEEQFTKKMIDANQDYITQQTRILGQKATNATIADISKTINPIIEQLQAERREAMQRAAGQGQMRGGAYGAIGAQMSANIAYDSKKDAALSEYLQAQQYLVDAVKISQAAQKGQGFWKGLGNSLGDVDTWDMGISQLVRSANLKKIVEKYEKQPDSLTDSERALMDAAVAYMSACAYNSDKLSRLYKAGQTTGESLPFMLQFAVMPIGAIKDKVAKGVLGYGIEKFGGKALQTAGKYTLGTAAKETGVALLGNTIAAGAMTGTFGAPKIAEGTISRMTGDINPQFDNDGRIVYGGRENQQGVGEALWNAGTDVFIENLSEMVLTSGDPLKAWVKGTNMFKRLGQTETAQVLAKMGEKWGESTIGRAAERMQFRSFPEEVKEEYIGNLMRWGASTDVNSAAEAGLDADSQIDLWMGLAPTSIAFAGLGLGEYSVRGGIDRFQSSQASRKLRKIMLEGEERKYLENLLKSRDSDEFKFAAHDVVKSILRNDQLSSREKRAYLDNLYVTYQSQLALEAEDAKIADEVKTEVQGITNKNNGYVYPVSLAGDPNTQGHIVAGYVEVDVTDPSKPRIGNDEIVTVKLNDGRVVQLSTKELDLTGTPQMAQEVFNIRAEERINNQRLIDKSKSAFHEGEEGTIQVPNPQTGELDELPSKILSVTDEGVQVEITDFAGQSTTALIPHDEALRSLRVVKPQEVQQEQPQAQETPAEQPVVQKPEAAVEHTADNIVIFSNGTEEKRAIDNDDGTYTIMEKGENNEDIPFKQTEEWFANNGYVKVEQEQPETQTLNQDQGQTLNQGASQTEGLGQGQNEGLTQIVPNIYTASADDYVRATVENKYKGNKAKAQANIAAQLNGAKSELQAAQREFEKFKNKGITSKMNSDQWDEQYDKYEQQIKGLTALVSKLEAANIAAAHYKTQAELQEEAERKAREAAMREQRRQLAEAEAAGDIEAKWQNTKKTVGFTATKTLPNGQKVNGHYILTEAGDVIPSHDPRQNYADSEGYVMENGQNVNDNNYKDPEVQKIANDIAQNYGGQAVEQMPFLENKAGRVLSGNNRTISGIIAAENNTDQAYLAALAENAQQYGFTTEQLAEYQHPRLQFVVEDELPFTTGTFAMFNAQEKKTKSSVNRAVANSKMITEAVRDRLLEIMDQYESLESFFASENAAAEIVQTLIGEGLMTQQEVAGLTESTDIGFKFSQSGREYVTDMLLGTLFDEQIIRMLAGEKTLKQAVLRALPSIVENRRLKGYELTESVNNAIKLLYEARNTNKGKSTADAFQLYLRQGNLTDGYTIDRYDAFDIILAYRMSAGVEQLRELLGLYNNSARAEANGQASLPGFERTVDDIKQEVYEYYTKQQPDLAAALNGAAEEGAQSQSPVSSGTANAGEVRQIISPEQLAALRQQAQEFSDKLGVPIVVFDSIDEVPDSESVAKELYKKEGNNVDAWMSADGKTIYVNANSPEIQSEGGLRRKVFHEIVAHKGLRQLMGNQVFDQLCAYVWEAMPVDQRVKYYDYAQQNYPGRTEDELRLIAADEYMAFNAEQFTSLDANDQSEAADEVRTIWQKIADKLRELLDKILGDSYMTDDFLAELYKISYNNLRQQAQEAKVVPERPNSKQLQGMSYNVAEAEDYIGRVVRNILDENGYNDVEIVGTKVIGSRVNGNAREDSDLDAIVEFKGDAREDSLFNLFAGENIELDGVKVDVNPITEGKSGTIEQFMRRSDEYLAEKTPGEKTPKPIGESTPTPQGKAPQTPTGSEKAAEIEIGGALVDRLGDMGLNVSTDLAANQQALQEAKADKSEAGTIHYFKTPSGKQYGFAYKGKVYLDPTKIDAELPIHEYGHLWAEALRRLNPENWQHVVDTIKADKEAWAFVRELRPELTDENEIAEEVIATFSGKNGAEKMRAEYERMHGKDADYKSKWGNIFKNISKAIQDFWKAVGDFLNIKYESAEQVYDQVLKDFVDNMNPWKRVSDYLQARDNEYVQAAESGDIKKATNLFYDALKENIGNGITPYMSVGTYTQLKRLAKGVKTRNEGVIKEAAAKIAPLIPDNAVLIPAPSHDGRATDMLDLAKAVAEITGSEVADVLRSAPRESQYQAKKATGVPMASGQLGITMEGTLPEGKTPIIIDNVVDSGNTAEACVQAVGRAVVVTIGDSAEQYGHAASLKSAAPVLRDKDGKVIPLSKRFEPKGSRYLGRRMYLRPDDLRLSVSGTQTIPVGKNTLVGLHNISAEKLRKALKMGGLANPSAAVIDLVKQDHHNYGDISLVMPSSLVDSETGRNAGTYAGDAYTPTYPGVEFHAGKDTAKKIEALTKGLPKVLDDAIQRHIRDYMDGNTYNSGLEYLFLKERGQELPIEHTPRRYPYITIEEIYKRLGMEYPGYYDSSSYEKYEAIPEDQLAEFNLWLQNAGNQEEIDKRKANIARMRSEGKDNFANTLESKWKERMSFANYDSTLYRIVNDGSHAGEENPGMTLDKAKDLVETQGLRPEFEEWMQAKIDDLGYTEVLFDGWTPSGNRRLLPNTLENASKIMNRQDQTNYREGVSVSETKSMLMDKFRTLAQIRKHKDILEPDEEKIKEAYEAVSDDWLQLGVDFRDYTKSDGHAYGLADNPFTAIDTALYRIQEAMFKRDPIAWLNKEYRYSIPADNEWLGRIMDLKQRITNLPARYFETKFRRPVYLDEFRNAVVPNDLPTELRDGLEKAGLTLFEYNPKEEGARRAATLQATEGEGIRFSISGNPRGSVGTNTGIRGMQPPVFEGIKPHYLQEMESIKNNALNDGTFMQAPNGKPTNLDERQWLQVRTRAFQRMFGDWINDKEHATKMLDENGEPQVFYHGTSPLFQFTTFRPSPYGKLGAGVYFTPSKQSAERYSNRYGGEDGGYNVFEVFLNIKDPYYSESQFLDDKKDEAAKHDGVIFKYEGEIIEVVAPNPNQIKSATENDGSFSEENDDIRFSISNQNNDIFYSNAERAVEGIKQEKATPEQWRAMIEKAGGLKAGEDKWIGLSDWLAQQRPTVTPQANETRSQFVERAAAENKRFTLSKQDLLDYIREHKIQIEETEYGDVSDSDEFKRLENEFSELCWNIDEVYTQRWVEENNEVEKFYDEMRNKYGDEYLDALSPDEQRTENYLLDAREVYNKENPDYDDAFQEMVRRYGDDFEMAFWHDRARLFSNDNSAAAYFADEANAINDTRLQYTTEGLQNKREIALTVPTIEAWNETDEIHFGDAGEGRAVAWVRFGDAKTVSKPKELVQAEQESKDFSLQLIKKYGFTYTESDMTEEEQKKARELEAKLQQARKDHPQVEEKVLVIDEIQSKRHQEGREKGYKASPTEEETKEIIRREKVANSLRGDKYDFEREMKVKYGSFDFEDIFKSQMTDAERDEWRQYDHDVDEAEAELHELKDRFPYDPSTPPVAPFEKNWHELAMKRILRFAAENGYDKVAWTTGEQQAKRYDIGKEIDHIVKTDENTYEVYPTSGLMMTLEFDENGMYADEYDREYNGKSMSDIFGKDLAKRLKEMPVDETLQGDGLRVGYDGMKGFYDDMLPRFMQKYGKKWGVQVGEVTMPDLEEGYQTMHSVDITPEMRESVMEGQPMFSITGSRGAANIDQMEGVTTRMDNLAAARQMEEDGKDVKTIRMATGWERGADGKWRYEIDDVQLNTDNVKANFRKLDRRGVTAPMVWYHNKFTDIIADSPERKQLLAAYPQLADLDIEFYDYPNKERGAYSSEKKKISVNRANVRSVDECRSVLLHEIQHAIQEAELFAKGTSKEQIQLTWKLNNEVHNKVDEYFDKMGFKEWLTSHNGDKAFVDRLTQVIHMFPNRDFNIHYLFVETLPRDKQIDAIDVLGDANDVIQSNRDAIYGADRKGMTMKPDELYHNAAGEVESRNVQNRMNLTPEERRERLLAETEDVAREDQVVIMNAFDMENDDATPRSTMDAQPGENKVQYAARIAEEIKRENPKDTSLDEAIRFSITVNHNSPYLLKRADGAFVDPETGERLGFDLRFMGQGEGGQAHGWGSYFSVNDLRSYANLPLINGGITQYFDVDKIDAIDERGRTAAVEAIEHFYYSGESMLDYLKNRLAANEAAVKEHREAGRETTADEVAKFAPRYKAAIAAYKGVSRHHYDVEIPDNDGTNYIEENDEPMDETELAILRNNLEQEILKIDKEKNQYYVGHENDLYHNILVKFKAGTKGRDIYPNIAYMLEDYYDNPEEAASKFLHDAGFVGIHYDGRRDGECYVIFNPDDAVITDHIRFSISGVRGAENMDKADGVTTRMDNLEIARDMEDSGKDAKAIKLATGWERGGDGKWRHYIPDLKIKSEVVLTGQPYILMKDLVDAPELFKAYPELQNIRVVYTDQLPNDVGGQYFRRSGEIALNSNYYTSDHKVRKHQAEMTEIENELPDIEQFREVNAKLWSIDSNDKAAWDEALKEHDAIFAQLKNNPLWERYVALSKDSEATERKPEGQSVLIHEVQHAIQAIEHFAQGSNKNDGKAQRLYKEQTAAKIEKRIKELESQLPSPSEQWTDEHDKIAAEIERLEDEARNIRYNTNVSEQAYHNAAGEVEARNAQTWAEMSPAERQNRLFVETEDVAREDQVFLFGNDNIAAADFDVERYDRENETEDQIRFSVNNPSTLSRSETVTKALVQQANNNYNIMQSALKKVTADLKGIRAAMRMQSDYDRKVVDALLNLYNTLLQENGVWAQYMPDTTRRIATQIVHAIGKRNITEEVNTIMDHMVHAQAKAAQRQWDKLRQTPIDKINISGVVMQGKVALEGQHALKAMNDALQANMTIEQIEEQINQLMDMEDNATDESLKTQYKGQWIGLTIAAQHLERLQHLQEERQQLDLELQSARSNKALKPAARQQLVDNIKQAMRDNYIEQAEAYTRSTQDLSEYVNTQEGRAKDFIRRQDANRDKIRSYAQRDLEGLATNPNRNRTRGNVARSIWDAFASPIRDLQSLLRLTGLHAPDGEGYLYNHFMRNWMDGADMERTGIVAASKTLDEKIAELTHGKYKTWEEAARKIDDASHNMFTITMLNGVDGKDMPVTEEIPLNAGNALYIYAVNKMNDGRMKLNGMNITEEDVQALADKVREQFGQEILDVVDWVQSEFFSQLRNRYNPTHEALFGAPMDAIENYFPLRINANARQQNEDLSEPDTDAARLLAGTSTGAIKRRTRNSLPLDVRNADFFQEVIRHISQMERWNAFAQWNRDANILFSDINFRNRIKGMKGTIYGEGDKLYNYMKDAFRVAIGTYKPKTDTFSEITLNMAKGVTSAKINFRIFTALKQIASFPAFFTYMQDGVFVGSYLRNWLKPHETMKWAKENLPNFEKRVSKRDMGDMRLMQRSTDWQWNKRILEWSSKYGMFFNVFFDTLTCATGARAVYDSHLADYLKKGYSEEDARNRARQDAEQAFNTSQQSSEGAFMSAVQQDRNLVTAALTVFRTSPIQYTRNFFYHTRNLLRKFGEGKRDEQIAFRMGQYKNDGLNDEQARKAAEKDYNKSLRQDIVGFVVYGALLNILWRLAGQIPYLLLGDDDDKKKQILDDATSGGAWFSPFTGLLGGGIVESALDGNGSVADMFAPEMPFTQDIKRAGRYLSNDKYAEFASQALSVLMQSGTGFDPLTASDMVSRIVTTLDSEEELDAATQALRVSQALLSIPQSQYEQMLIDKVVSGETDEDAALEDFVRYYKVHRAPLTFFLRNEENDIEAEENAERRFNKLLTERDKIKNPEDYEE